MRRLLQNAFRICLLAIIFCTANLQAQTKIYDSTTIAAFKQQVLPLVAGKEKQVQEMIDMIFSFGELGFQETETSKYLTDILTK
ncbi:MAG: amidohydrolase, partial [Pedobacter sp.]|nr:amidohydrolase [Chitinophagaceae bacterium]